MRDLWMIEYKVSPCFDTGYAVRLRAERFGDAGYIARAWPVERLGGLEMPTDYNPPPRDFVRLSNAESDVVAAQLAGVAIPACPTLAAGLDGTTHELTLQAGSNAAIYHWWHDLPECWAALEPGVSALREIAKRCFADRDEQPPACL